MSTGCPIEIRTSQRPSQKITYCKLDIDIVKNQPNVIELDKVPNPDGFRGSEVSVIIEGSWTTYRSKILSYLRQLAIITPYALIEFKFQTFREK